MVLIGVSTLCPPPSMTSTMKLSEPPYCAVSTVRPPAALNDGLPWPLPFRTMGGAAALDVAEAGRLGPAVVEDARGGRVGRVVADTREVMALAPLFFLVPLEA